MLSQRYVEITLIGQLSGLATHHVDRNVRYVLTTLCNELQASIVFGLVWARLFLFLVNINTKINTSYNQTKDCVLTLKLRVRETC